MRKALCAAAAMLAVTAPLFAETSAERGKRVVREAIEALGGENFLRMQDRVERGRAYSFYRERLSGLARATLYTRYLTRPEPPAAAYFGIRERQVFGKDEDAYVILNENEAYDVTWRGARPLPEAAYERFKESTLRNVFYILKMRVDEPKMLTESRGADVVNNQPVEIVEFIDADNRSVTVYFHQSTKLPLRQVTQRREPGKDYPIEEVTEYSKYRDVGGVKWPFAFQRQRDGEKIFEMFADSVEVNKSLPDNLFTLEADVKVLPRK